MTHCKNTARLRLESLETRDVMSVSSATINFGTLKIICNDGADNLEIRRVDPFLDHVLEAAPTGTASKGKRIVTLPNSKIEVTDKSVSPNAKFTFRAADVQRLDVELLGGNDLLNSLVGLPTVVNGGAGHDTICTGAAADVILGGIGNDLIKSGAGSDSLHGEADNDTLIAGPGEDFLFGGLGFNQLRGEANDDFISAQGRSDIVDGGDGYDRFQLVAKTVNPTKNGEDITITVPQDQPQDDGWSCGPNSGSRFLRAHGINVSYSQLRSQVTENSLISKFHLGTLPDDLRYVIGKHKSLTSIEKESNLNRVLKLLSDGKPVIALVARDKVAIETFGVTVGHYGTMHYVLLNGFDQATQTIRYVDTDGVAKTWTHSEFDYRWKWFDHFTGAGEVAQGVLYGLGMRKRTLIV